MAAERMKAPRWARPLLIVSGVVVLIVSAVATWLFQEVVYLRIDSPAGRHTAVVSCRRYESFRPTFAGQAGDREGFIRIQGKNGVNYGRIGVPMVGMSRDLEWRNDGADLKLVCEWDFAEREYRFWNESQTREIVKSVR